MLKNKILFVHILVCGDGTKESLDKKKVLRGCLIELSKGQWYPHVTDTFINVHIKCRTDFVALKGCLVFKYKENPYTKDILIRDSKFVGNLQDRCLRIDHANSVTIINTHFEKCGAISEVGNQMHAEYYYPKSWFQALEI